MENEYKIYINIRISISKEGLVAPISFEWVDGRVFDVDKVLDRQKRTSNVGSAEMRYTCKIKGKEIFLFQDFDGRWYIEKKVG